MLAMQTADFALHNKFIDTFPTSLLTPICKFPVSDLSVSDLKMKAN